TEESSNANDKASDDASESSEDAKQETVITNYEIPKTIERIVDGVGVIKRLTIAVLLDGVHEEIIDEDGVASITTSPRPQEELDRLTSIVKSAVGFDGDRSDQIEVYNINFDNTQFADLGAQGGAPDYYFYIDLVKRFGGWALIVVVALYVRKRVKGLFQSLKAIVPAPRRTEMEAPEAIQDEKPAIKAEKRRPKLLDQMQQTAKERPDELAKVIKTMMVAAEK
ncbi:MAG: flagellar M-ring protein FliF C-terminal domain-containing protein, partial [Candidatus Zixiibacteriota bacterium]